MDNETRRQVLMSIREPTEEMMVAAGKTPGLKIVNDIIMHHAIRTNTQPLAETTAEHGYPLAQAWRARIDHLLKETPS